MQRNQAQGIQASCQAYDFQEASLCSSIDGGYAVLAGRAKELSENDVRDLLTIADAHDVELFMDIELYPNASIRYWIVDGDTDQE